MTRMNDYGDIWQEPTLFDQEGNTMTEFEEQAQRWALRKPYGFVPAEMGSFERPDCIHMDNGRRITDCKCRVKCSGSGQIQPSGGRCTVCGKQVGGWIAPNPSDGVVRDDH